MGIVINEIEGGQYYTSPGVSAPYSLSQTSDNNHEASIPRSMPSTPPQSTPRRTQPMSKDQMLGPLNRPTYMNHLAAPGERAMSDVIFGFRPESGWSGVLFQVFLQGPFVEAWKKQEDMDYWLSFGGISMKAVFYEMESSRSVPDIGTKRYILQCIVPLIDNIQGPVPVTLRVFGEGGKAVASGLFIGFFHRRPNGIFPINRTNGRWHYKDI